MIWAYASRCRLATIQCDYLEIVGPSKLLLGFLKQHFKAGIFHSMRKLKLLFVNDRENENKFRYCDRLFNSSKDEMEM